MLVSNELLLMLISLTKQLQLIMLIQQTFMKNTLQTKPKSMMCVK